MAAGWTATERISNGWMYGAGAIIHAVALEIEGDLLHLVFLNRWSDTIWPTCWHWLVLSSATSHASRQAMITRCLNLLQVYSRSLADMVWHRGTLSPSVCRSSRHEIINLTTELALTETAYRRLVVALPTSDLNPGATLRVVIRSRTPGLVAVDQAGLGGAGLVRLSPI